MISGCLGRESIMDCLSCNRLVWVVLIVKNSSAQPSIQALEKCFFADTEDEIQT
jgi:hypothetical protein